MKDRIWKSAFVFFCSKSFWRVFKLTLEEMHLSFISGVNIKGFGASPHMPVCLSGSLQVLRSPKICIRG